MTNLDPTSLEAILPSGETFDLVRPGMSRVVGRTRGVLDPEFCLIGKLERVSAVQSLHSSEPTDSLGLLGAVVAGVSFKACVREPCLGTGGRLNSPCAVCGDACWPF